MTTDDTREALAEAIYPGVTNGAGEPNLLLALHARVLDTIHDVIADCGDNSPAVLASNIANALANPLATHVAALVAERDGARDVAVELGDERDTALAQLGAIAALVEKYESTWEPDAVRIGDRIRAILADSAGATAKHEQEVRARDRAWAERFLEEWARPYFGDDASDAVAAVMRADAAARADAPTEGQQ